jgi:archaellum biogenesis ATPase FlaH
MPELETLDFLLAHIVRSDAFVQTYPELLNADLFLAMSGDFTNHKREILFRAIDYGKTHQQALGVSALRALLSNYAQANAYSSAKWKAAQGYANALSTAELVAPDTMREIVQGLQTNFVKARLRADLENPEVKLTALGASMDLYASLVAKTEPRVAVVPGVDNLLAFLDNTEAQDWRSILYSGIFLFDTLLGRGLTKPKYSVIVGPTKSGKSFLLLNLSWGYWFMRRNVIHFSFEDTEDTVQQRSAAFLSKIEYPQADKMLPTEHRERLTQIRAAVAQRRALVGSNAVIQFVPASGQKWSSSQIREEIRRQESALGVKFDVCVVDYLGEMSNNRGRPLEKRHEDLQLISSELREVATGENLLLWTACQSTLEEKALKKMMLEPSDIAEAKGVIRTVDIALSIGYGAYVEEAEPNGHHSRTLSVMRSKIIPQGKPVQVVGNLDLSTFFDNNLTQQYAVSASMKKAEAAADSPKKKGRKK